VPEVKIAAEARTEFGKGAARRSRREGKVPAVLYGHGTETRHLSLPGHALMLALKTPNVLLRLEGLTRGGEIALPKAVQRDPVRGILEHVDLILVRSGEKVTIEVPIRITGEIASGDGGMLNQQIVQIPVEAEATNIPQGIDVDTKAHSYQMELLNAIETLKSTDDRTIVPKGTKIEGHITQATARGKGGEESALGIQFDKAVLKEGGEISLNVVIQALAAPMRFAAPSDLGTTPRTGTTQTSPMSGTRSAPPPSAQSPQVGSAPDSESTSSPQLDAKSRGVIGMRGITLNAESANNRPASVVVSNGKSVHLDGGTRMLLVVQSQGSEPAAK